MVDVHTKKQRSYNMSQIRSYNTGPELRLKKILCMNGFSYQPKIYGKPDFADFSKKIVIFIDGCFWHKCPKHYTEPATNRIFWKNKIGENVRRDREIQINYENSGWKVIRIWEHQVFINTKILKLI